MDFLKLRSIPTEPRLYSFQEYIGHRDQDEDAHMPIILNEV